MADGEVINSNISMGGSRIDGDHLSIRSLKDFSIDEDGGAAEVEAALKPSPAVKDKTKNKAIDFNEEDTDDEDENIEKKETEEDDEDEEDLPKKQSKKTETKETEEDDEDEEDDESDEDEEEVSSKSKDKYSVASKGDKTYKVPKDAEFEININGKMQKVPLQEMINKASAGIHYEKELSTIGREKKELKVEKQAFYDEREATNENINMLFEISQNGTPEDFVVYYGLLTQKEPEEVMRQLVDGVVKYVDQFSKMTPAEKKLYNENRKFKFQQTLQKRKSAQADKLAETDRKLSEVQTGLKKVGANMDDFISTVDEIKEKIASGEFEDEEWTPLDVVDYIAVKKAEERIKTPIGEVDSRLLKDDAFVKRVIKAIKSAEELSGETFTRKEIKKLVRQAAGIDNKAISDSLSKKANSAIKSGKTNSKNAKLQKQNDDDEGSLTLKDHRKRLLHDGWEHDME